MFRTCKASNTSSASAWPILLIFYFRFFVFVANNNLMVPCGVQHNEQNSNVPLQLARINLHHNNHCVYIRVYFIFIANAEMWYKFTVTIILKVY